MRQLKFAIYAGGAIIVLLLLPWLVLKIAGLAVPRLLLAPGAMAVGLIPIEIGLFFIYFTILAVTLLLQAIRLRSRIKVIEACLLLPCGDMLLGYALVAAIKVCWPK